MFKVTCNYGKFSMTVSPQREKIFCLNLIVAELLPNPFFLSQVKLSAVKVLNLPDTCPMTGCYLQS